ncbi:hypothetical protein [Citrobacter amalonaticus]|nr:hypothetical protein [Citrobacter amalonaticus]
MMTLKGYLITIIMLIAFIYSQRWVKDFSHDNNQVIDSARNTEQ